MASRGDEAFKQSMADLSRQLGERMAGQSPDPRAAAEARRAALEAYDRVRAHRLKWALGAAGTAVVAACVAWFVLPFVSFLDLSLPSLTASREPASPLVTAVAEPAPAPRSPPSSPSPAASAPSPPAVTPVPTATLRHAAAQGASAPDSQPPPPVTAERMPKEATLRRDEVSEVQARLRSFGFDPGPVDGAAGPKTEGAVVSYQQARAQQPTGKVDRQLLEQLRQDSAPQVQVAQRAARPAAPRAASSPPTRSADPFEPIRTAGLRINQWLESLTR